MRGSHDMTSARHDRVLWLWPGERQKGGLQLDTRRTHRKRDEVRPKTWLQTGN